MRSYVLIIMLPASYSSLIIIDISLLALYSSYIVHLEPFSGFQLLYLTVGEYIVISLMKTKMELLHATTRCKVQRRA